mmetsp:Transcript_44267/g.73732  ORF Transcript_44267/g.73732 Transcript_44267/m.73732 type:complete len:211 (+) Transcript_44267:157-789(+)
MCSLPTASPSAPASSDTGPAAAALLLCNLMQIGLIICFPFRHCGWNDRFGRKWGGGVSTTGPLLSTNNFEGPVAILVSSADWMSARITRRAPSDACFFRSTASSTSLGGRCSAAWFGHHCNKHAIFGRAGEAPSTTSISVPLLVTRNCASTSSNKASTSRTNLRNRRSPAVVLRLLRRPTKVLFVTCSSSSSSSILTVSSIWSYGPGHWF